VYSPSMAYTFDIRTDTNLLMTEYQTLLEEAQRKVDVLEAQSQHIARQLHDAGCSNHKSLVVGSNCCDANLWINKARRVTECAIYAYKVISDAPHHKTCPMTYRGEIVKGQSLPTECSCWKSKGMENMISFFQGISNEKV
jgi:hypothetical protein